MSQPGTLWDDVDRELDAVPALVERIFGRDHTVWQEDPTEVADRLGWLDCPAAGADDLAPLTALADGVAADGITDVVLVGMGGSSLFPEVLAAAHRPADGRPRLTVLDSTAPAAVARTERDLDWSRTLLVAASKSGTTIETRSHLDRLWHRLDEVGTDPASRVVAITDPGSPLASWGAEQGIRAVLEATPDVGGRFSALTAFGLAPAALLGLDLRRHLDGAGTLLDAARRGDVAPGSAAHLGTALAVAAHRGRDKLTLLLPEALTSFGAWVEQLVAESTGKHGRGILPVVDEPLRAPDAYGHDRLFVAVGEHAGLDAIVAAGHPVVALPDAGPGDLGREVARWELATALAGALLGVNPFDQPDVAAAKDATARVLEAAVSGTPPDVAPDGDASALLDDVRDGDYLALLAFADPAGPLANRVRDAAQRLRGRLRVPVTVGIGPRYLHSTGQLHKGGPNTGMFLQVVDETGGDVAIPGRTYGFATLLRAQAAGDLEALRDRGHRAARLDPDAVPTLGSG